MEKLDQTILKEHVDQHQHAYKSKILRPDVHMKLVQNLPHLAEQSRIPQRYVWTSMKEKCGESEIEWVRSIRRNQSEGVAGLVYTGSISELTDRMMLIAGCLMRNYMDARVFTVQEVIEKLKDGTMPDPTVLLIPNFFLKKDEGGDIPSWQVSSLLGLLYKRFAAQKHTVLYVQSMHGLRDAYGDSFHEHINTHFNVVK